MTKRFSERIGAVETPHTLQMEGMNDALRNSLWNYLHSLFESQYEYWRSFARSLANHFRKTPVDDLPYYDHDCRKWVKEYFYSLKWHEVYDIIEYVTENYRRIVNYPGDKNRDNLQKIANFYFERELSGFRFVAGVLVPISSVAETSEITGALEATSRKGLDGAREHLHTALTLLAKKPKPDYRNSVKESISAVESVSRVLGKSDTKGLADALEELGKKTDIHGALVAGFTKLYGYTSDEDGIRHAILESTNVGFDEAKYMIVSCSAFVNYLIAKASAGDLLKDAK
jgi:hypothetical protein